jgi:hypothetical protein
MNKSRHLLRESKCNLKNRKSDRRGWMKLMKIPWVNSVYILKLIWCISLLTRSRPHNYKKISAFRSGLVNLKTQQKTNNQCKKTRARSKNKNPIKKSVHVLTDISPNKLWTCWETTVWERLKLENLKSFDLITQEQYQLHLQQFTHNLRNQMDRYLVWL